MKKRIPHTKKKLPVILAAFLMIAGAVFLLYHPITGWLGQREAAKETERFYQIRGQLQEEKADSGSAAESDAYERLRKDMETYNVKIYSEGQKDLKDAWSYEQPVFQLKDYGVDTDVIGVLTIQDMGIELPVYLGATEANMAKGAVVLGQTSMPTGGKNTNCVIAAHRGYGSQPMFREIEALKPGDPVVLDTLWGRLEYQVQKTRIILPDDIDAVRIQSGQELLTLITCHPYRYNSHRYVVYCTPAGQETGTAKTDGQEQTEERSHIEGEESEALIMALEERLPVLAIPLLIFGVLLWILPGRKQKRQNSKKKTSYRKKERRER